MGKSNRFRGFLRIWHIFSQILDFIFCFLELHIVKIVALTIMILCCTMVNALHLVIVVFLLLSMLFGSSAIQFSFSFIGPFLGILYICKMMYETDFVPSWKKLAPCYEMNATFHSALEQTILDPEWWGFFELQEGNTMVSYYKGYILVFLVMTLKAVIELRQKIVRIDAGKSPKVPHVMYPKTTRKDADKNLKSCVQYLLNYGFYKLGFEITLTFCVFTIAIRLDIFSVIYAIWIAILFALHRTTVVKLWPFYLGTLLLCILWQNIMALGFSKSSCFEYPWENQTSLAEWFFLPTSKIAVDSKKTIADFILLLLIQRQAAVFDLEKRYGDKYLGGSNKEIYMNYYKSDFANPTPDHTGSIRSWLDFVKYICLSCLFKITLAILFWTGASNANILSLGYLVGAFVFLWIDYDLCLWEIKKILRWWNVLLGYTVAVILANSVFEFPRCVYSDFLHENSYWLVELLFLHCERHPIYKHEFHVQYNNMMWHVACFGLILFQRKYFQSYYFLHQKEDVLAVFRLQAKGAKLVDDLQENKLKDFQMRERKTLMKIKKKMKRIKAWQKRIQGLNYTEPTNHTTATYMGDYSMFDDAVGSTKRSSSSSSSSDDEFIGKKGKGPKSRDRTMTKFLGSVLKGHGEEPGQGSKKKPNLQVPDGSSKDGKKKPEKEKKGDSKSGKEEQETEQHEYKKDNARKCWSLFVEFLDSVVVSLIRFFNKHSKDYRLIESVMKEERKSQKECKLDSSLNERKSEKRSISTVASKYESLNARDYMRRFSVKSDEFKYLDEENGGHKKSFQKLLVMLIDAICMFIMSKTELLCYMIIFLHTVISPSLISIPLPFLVLLWGSLTSVRPTTTFWTVLIAYTEITVVLKALFQNGIFPWNTPETWKSQSPDYPPMFLGIHRDNQFVVADLFLLLLLFLHRYKLKTLGLWNRTHEEETFLPQNLNVYKVLPSEADLKDFKGNRSLLNQRKLFTEPSEMITQSMRATQIATWKCTSRATAKVIYWNNNIRTRIKIKEIEGPILVTHEGRRLEPTNLQISQMREEELEGKVMLRVYVDDIADTKGLFYRLSWVQHFTQIRKFFVQVVVRDWRVSADFYTAMFIFQFIDFFIVFFGYSTFTEVPQVQGNDYFALTENQVLPLHLVTMIAHFLVIIIDRILYLRKCVIGKLILQFILVVAVHIWMFIIVPTSTESPFNKLPVPQTYYIFCCLYFLMSAFQLRVGYPVRVQGHFLCKKYGYFNYHAYRCLRYIPFFNQLRAILDYLCTHSSLTLLEFIKMESIFQLVFINKCSRRSHFYKPSPRGEECPKCKKYTPTLFVLFGMIVVIWLPFIIFALFNTVAQPNLPQDAALTITVGNFGKLYTATVTVTDIITLTDFQFQKLQGMYKDNRKIWSFMSLFDNRDVAVLKFRFDPYEPWIITPNELTALNKTLQNTDIPISLYIRWQMERIPRSLIVEKAKGFTELILNKNKPARHQFAKALVDPNASIVLNKIFPKFIHVSNEGEARPVSGFMGNTLRSAKFTLINQHPHYWWKLQELYDDPEENKLSKLPFYTTNETTIYTFNEKNIPKVLLNVSKKGIIGLYISIVLVLWTITKRFMWKYPYMMFDDMPNPDPVLKLCHDIYLARESHEFALEEDLYAKLLFLFRSPETMIKVTRLNTQVQNTV